MGTIEVIKKFIESNWVIERAVREVLERLPLRFRYGISASIMALFHSSRFLSKKYRSL
ncbi:hypothetical protein BMS3Bbin06_00105 [bacterium BMS3Bbin06]|nr:hypothetical protein BMS3Bbin06_00105 [bacterium BMS3Bbin06]